MNILTPTSCIYVGIDVSKASHVAGFLSAELLAKHSRFEKCPTLKVKNSRSGFESLAAAMKAMGPLDAFAVLMEVTGHYHRALLDFCLEQGITCYLVNAQERMAETKTDKLDSLYLANKLYSQLHLGVQYADPSEAARLCVAPSEAASILRCLVRHRYELSQEATRRKNKLTSILDEVFPEFTEVFIDPNVETALNVRERFLTAQAIAEADLDALKACRTWRRPSTSDLIHLKELAASSIGCRDQARLRGLCLEQGQLIAELRMLGRHLQDLDAEITSVLADSREGQILTSIDGIGPVHAAEIIAYIGCIANFASKGHLRRYFGWSPRKEQSGTSLDTDSQTRSGNRLMKHALWLTACTAVSQDTEWRRVYQDLLPRLCRYDASKSDYIGKNKVIGRIAGQLTGVMYSLLKKDYDVLLETPAGTDPPPPILYSREVHRAALKGAAGKRHS